LRHDTVRLAILNTLQAVFFFQPFFRLAVREVHLAAEEQCDDWAASQLEDRFAMASCLTEVAGWVVRRDRRIPVPCMGRRRSQLEIRVRRLMDERRSLETPSRAWQLGFVGLLVIAPWLAPAVALAGNSHADLEAAKEHGQRQAGQREQHDRLEHSRVERQAREEHEGRGEHEARERGR